MSLPICSSSFRLSPHVNVLLLIVHEGIYFNNMKLHKIFLNSDSDINLP